MLREAVIKSGLSRPAKAIWDAIYPFTPKKHARDAALMRLYRQFIKAGDIVYDVGANLGNYTELFIKLHASVVAIEPNQALVKKLTRRFADEQVSILPYAAGHRDGWANFRECEINGLSSCSEKYIYCVSQNRFSGIKWDKPKRVQSFTLDTLFKHYGTPAFIKIDCEGYEPEVISGIQTPVPALSFEFIPEAHANTERCIELLDNLGDYRYSYTIGLEPDLQFQRGWVDGARLLGYLKKVNADVFGDVYAKLSVNL
jgi:FkbM family methyltransferase